MSLESGVERKAVKLIKRRWPESKTLKIRPFADRGWPDRIFFLPKGVTVLIEFKRPGKTPRKNQHRKLKDLKELDHYAYWTDSAEEAFKFCLRAAKLSERRNKVPTPRRLRAVPRSRSR